MHVFCQCDVAKDMFLIENTVGLLLSAVALNLSV